MALPCVILYRRHRIIHDVIQTFVGVLLVKQPFLILGIDNYDTAKDSAFGAAGAFFVTFLLSITYLFYEGRRMTYAVEGRGHVNRFGEYSTVGFVDSYDADPFPNTQGSFT
jgi:hypothetical protein